MTEEAEVEVVETENDTTQQPEDKREDKKTEVDIVELVKKSKEPKATEEPNEEPENQDKKEFDPKKDRVDFSTPEQQAKFDDVYKQMKKSDARNKMLTDLLEEVTGRLDKIENKDKQTQSAEAEKLLFDKIIEANDEGDVESLTKSIDELVKYRAENTVKAQIDEYTKKISQNDLAQAQTVEEFMNQKDDKGDFMYPWMQEDDPRFEEFLQKSSVLGYQLSQKNPNDPNLVYKTMQKANEEMLNWEAPKQKKQPSTRTPDPMQGSNLTQQEGRNKIKMTQAELEIARRLGVDPKKYAQHRG